ncbi:MAG: hypothetical protein AAF490_15290 [Chloroflexota bacterium]
MNRFYLLGLIFLFIMSSACVPGSGGDVIVPPTLPVITVEPTSVVPTPISQITPTPPPPVDPTATVSSPLPEPTDTPMPPPNTPTPSPDLPIRIEFEQGAVSATINGRIEAGQSINYLAWANAGQKMKLELLSHNSMANFSIVGQTDGQPYKRLVNEDRLWEGDLTQAQDYLIGLHALEAVDYIMHISIVDQPDIVMPAWPIIDAEFGMILGGAHNGRWLDPITVMNSINDVERPYRIHGYEGEREIAIGSLPYLAVGPCHNQPFVNMTSDADNVRDAVATMATWDLQPRQPEAIPVDTAVYQEEIRALLEASALTDPVVNIVSIDRIDLEGDGVDEVLIHASNLTGLGNGLPTANAGDYELLALRKVVNGTVSTMPLLLEVYPADVNLVTPSQIDVLGYFDLNGNDRLEFVVELMGYEHRFVHLYESIPQGALLISNAGCSH